MAISFFECEACGYKETNKTHSVECPQCGSEQVFYDEEPPELVEDWTNDSESFGSIDE